MLSLTPENMDELESMSLHAIIDFLEKKDDLFLAQMPSFAHLAQLYGNPESQQLFRLRDLHLLWRQMYLHSHPEMEDMLDESRHFSIHL